LAADPDRLLRQAHRLRRRALRGLSPQLPPVAEDQGLRGIPGRAVQDERRINSAPRKQEWRKAVRRHQVRVRASGEGLDRESQLAWRIAEVASDPVAVPPEIVEIVIDRLIDTSAAAIAALNRDPVVSA